ncbi:hypothetical protein GCM10027614_82640 [Micromonospora vulcania]
MVPHNIARSDRTELGGDVLDSSAWWRALPLEERRRSPVTRTTDADLRGTRRLDAWRTDRTVTGGLEPDLSRWHRSGLSEDELRLLLGESPDSLRDRLPEPPPGSPACRGPGRSTHPNDPFGDGPTAEFGPSAGLLALVHPLLSAYQRGLHEELNRRAREVGHQDEIPLHHPLLQPHHGVHLSMISPVLAVHLQRARAAGALSGDTPTARYADFVRQLQEPAYALAILAAHPTLARELVDEVESWVAVRRELADRLLADLPRCARSSG